MISPIGAIANGLELMQMSGGPLTAEMALITDSVQNANARIRFFRVAYGLATAQQMMGRAEIVSVLQDVAQGTRVRFQWGPLDPVPRAEVRLVFLAIQCFETAMPYGGQVMITREDGCWTLDGQADRLRSCPDLWRGLASPDSASEVSPSEVQFALLPLSAQDEGRQVAVTCSESGIVMRF
ncbi:MAG: histidine phosphotransferase family protein [Rhodobacterales bacterium]